MAVTIYDIAKSVGTTHATVSRALHNNPRISDETKEKVRKAAEKLGYRPNHAARSFGTGKTHTIGLITPDLGNPYYVEYIRAVEEVCASKGYRLVCLEYIFDADRERLCLEEMLERRCDGIIATITRFEALKDIIEEFWERRIPFISSGLPSDAAKSNIDGTSTDHGKGIEQAIDHLIDLGHKEIVFVASWAKQFKDYGRFSGLEKGFKKHGLPYNFEDRVFSRFTGDQLRDGMEATKELLLTRPNSTAIIGTNDLVAVGVMRTVYDFGLKVPEDISIVGCDNTWLAKNLPVRLTTIDHKTKETAKVAVEILFERLQNKDWIKPQRIGFESELVIGESTAKVRQWDLPKFK